MSRFDDELRRAAGRLIQEPMPSELLDEALDSPSAAPRRWLPAGATVMALIAVVAVGVVGGRLIPEPSRGPLADATPSATSDPSPQAVRHEVEVDGIRLTVELESDRATAGVPVLATATVENLRDQPIWHPVSSSCEWATNIAVYPNPRFELGQTWDGDAAQLKRSLLREWGYEDPRPNHEFTPYYFVGAERLPDLHTGCFMDAGRSEIPAGSSRTDELAWRPTGPFGMPMPPGRYQLRATFARIPDGEFHNRDASDDVSLSFEIEIEGPAFDLLMPGEAIDSVLADERLWATLVDALPERPGRPELEWVDGVWRMSFALGHLEGPLFVTSHFIKAEVDALTGEVLLLESTETGAEAPPVQQVSESVEIPGVVRFSLRLDRDRTMPGQPVWADLVVENIGSDEVLWATTGGCPLWPTAERVDPPGPEPYGRTDWTGDARVLKSVTVDEEADLEHDFLPEEHIGLPRVGCDMTNVPQTLASGESRTYRSVWYAENEAGVPVAAGDYHLDAELRVAGGPLMVRVPLTVNAFDLEWLSPGEALDRLLEEPALQELLAEYPRNRWNSQDLVFEDERWKLRIYVSSTPTDWAHAGAILGTVDALTGHVYGIRFDAQARPAGCEEPPAACDP